MAGSIGWFEYITDGGVLYSVKLDESNARGTIAGTRLCAARTARHPRVPRDFEKRYINAVLLANPRIRRKFWIGNPAAWAKIGVGAVVVARFRTLDTVQIGTSDSWLVRSRQGERVILPPGLNANAGDTGLTDGSVAIDQ